MISFEQVSKHYPGSQSALDDISFNLGKGEFSFLTGHSGAGKSTFLKLIAALETPSQGSVIVNGKNTHDLGHKDIPYFRRQIGIVFQNHQLLNDRSVFDNVALPLLICGYHQSEIRRRVCAALDRVGLLQYEKANPLTLSGGEQQRVGIARAVVNRPSLLLADEPTGNLDPALSAEVMKLFLQFNQAGVSVLIATHDLDLITRLRAPVVSLRKGKIIQDDLREYAS